MHDNEDPQTHLLPDHEVVNLFPELGEEESEALLQSIQRTGVLNEVLTWRDPEGKKWLVDGRNRRNQFRRLIDNGVTETEKGEPLVLREREFTGNAYEMMGEVLGLNRDRRNLSSSQKAAITVKSGRLATKYAKKLKIKVPGGSPDDIVARLARDSGTNRSYIFDCKKLQAEAPKLLDAVASGEMKLPAAMAELRKMKDKLAEEAAGTATGEEGSEEAATEPEGDEVPTVYDGNKEPVPEEFKPVFVTREDYRTACKKLREVKTLVDKIAEGAGAAHLDTEAVFAALATAISGIEGAKPHVICPACTGTGKEDGSRKKCEVCAGKRYLHKKLLAAYNRQKASEGDPAAETTESGEE